MITLLLTLLRLFPSILGGHRQLAIENLALRQLSVYKRTTTRPKLPYDGPNFWIGLRLDVEQSSAVAQRSNTHTLLPSRSISTPTAAPHLRPCSSFAQSVSRSISTSAVAIANSLPIGTRAERAV